MNWSCVRIAVSIGFMLPCMADAEASCNDVYANATSNISANARQDAENQYNYSKYCENSGQVKNSSSSSGLSVAYAGIQLGWSGTDAEAAQMMKQFCSTQHSVSNVASSSSSFQSTVVVDALKSYNDCRAMEVSGLRMTNTTNLTSVVIRGDFDPSASRVVLKNVSYDDTIGSCQTTSINGKAIIVGRKMPEFEPRESFTIACTRRGKQSSGQTLYPRFEVIVATNKGNYGVSMLNDDLLGLDLASEQKNRLIQITSDADQKETQLQTLLAAEQQKSAAIQTRLDNVSVSPFRLVMQGDGQTVSCPQNGGNLTAYEQSACGSAKVLDGVFSSNGGGTCGYTGHVFACLSK